MRASIMTIGLVAAFCSLVTTPLAIAATVVIPNVNESTPGPMNWAYPYNGAAHSGIRVQQVFAADQFQGLAGAITRIAFRVDEEFGGPFTSAPIDTEIRMCHTSAAPNAMSTTFADNLGSDVTLVFDGMLVISSAGTGAFDIVIDVADTFIYDGVQNLLVEYKVFGATGSSQVDAAGISAWGGGTPWTDQVWNYGPDAETGSSGGPDGCVTQFTNEPANATETTTWGQMKSTFGPK